MKLMEQAVSAVWLLPNDVVHLDVLVTFSEKDIHMTKIPPVVPLDVLNNNMVNSYQQLLGIGIGTEGDTLPITDEVVNMRCLTTEIDSYFKQV